MTSTLDNNVIWAVIDVTIEGSASGSVSEYYDFLDERIRFLLGLYTASCTLFITK